MTERVLLIWCQDDGNKEASEIYVRDAKGYISSIKEMQMLGIDVMFFDSSHDWHVIDAADIIDVIRLSDVDAESKSNIFNEMSEPAKRHVRRVLEKNDINNDIDTIKRRKIDSKTSKMIIETNTHGCIEIDVIDYSDCRKSLCDHMMEFGEFVFMSKDGNRIFVNEDDLISIRCDDNVAGDVKAAVVDKYGTAKNDDKYIDDVVDTYDLDDAHIPIESAKLCDPLDDGGIRIETVSGNIHYCKDRSIDAIIDSILDNTVKLVSISNGDRVEHICTDHIVCASYSTL